MNPNPNPNPIVLRAAIKTLTSTLSDSKDLTLRKLSITLFSILHHISENIPNDTWQDILFEARSVTKDIRRKK